MTMIWQKGRRLFTVAAVLMIVVAALHTLGQFGPSSGPAERAAVDAMTGFHIDFGLGMRPSLFGVFRALAFTMTITFVALGLMNLVLASSPDISTALFGRIIWINVLWVAAFTALSFGYEAPPPLISGIVILVFLVGSLIGNRKR